MSNNDDRLTPGKAGVCVAVQVNDVRTELRVEFEQPITRSVDIGPGARLPFESETLFNEGDTVQIPKLVSLFIGRRGPEYSHKHLSSGCRESANKIHRILPDASNGVGGDQDS
jgi:hypothetical protein